MGKPSAPQAPDYAGAATAQAAGSKEAALAAGQLANPNVQNPYGNQTVTYSTDPTTGNPVPNVKQTLAPGQQGIFDTNQAIQKKLGMLGITAADLAGKTVSTPLDFNKQFGTQAQGRQATVDAMMGRYDADLARRRDADNSNLIARGIPQGSKAYQENTAMLDRGRNDAFQQAGLAADARSLEERRQAITEALAMRQIPLNEVSALRSGSQIQPLSFSGVQSQGVQGPQSLDAATQRGAFDQAGYKTDAGLYNNTMEGLFKIGAATAPIWGPMISDRRLKSNIVRIGTHPLGIGIYSYIIFGEPDVGVMADEVERVMPEAVLTHPSGYQMVNYALLTDASSSTVLQGDQSLAHKAQ